MLYSIKFDQKLEKKDLFLNNTSDDASKTVAYKNTTVDITTVVLKNPTVDITTVVL
jgi:hypothetical protein